MKKTLFFMIVLAGIVVFNSCKKDGYEPVLDKSGSPVINSPADNSSFILLEAQEDEAFTAFSWNAADFSISAGRNWELLNPSTLSEATYTLQLDTEADNFSSPVALTSTTATTFTMSVGEMNGKLLGMGLATGTAHNLVLRVMADLTNSSDMDNVYSEVVHFTVTPFEAQIFYPPIYLLGDATQPGWDNANALPMFGFSETQFAIVASLSGEGKFLKFIKTLGAWAPQWGTDATGTGEGGPLVYRPDETVADPPAIPAPVAAGEYRIFADIQALTYTITKASETLYLLGDGTTPGWDNANALPMTKLSPGVFEISTTLGGSGKFFKFIETLGQWAPQYGTDDFGTSDGGNLIFRPTEAVPDPKAMPCPATAGSYKITVNLASMTYTVTPL
jgi:hypothetical protein